MRSILEWAHHLLSAPTLVDKLTPCPPQVPLGTWIADFTVPATPGRETRLAFSDRQTKFPKAVSLGQAGPRAQALHSFANHEMLAIEMMAAALLAYPHVEGEEGERWKRGLVSAIRDEQKHLALYVRRLRESGADFGDFPLNDFFWRQMPGLKTAASFFATMSLTFESANLDFALYYRDAFRAVGDDATADILQVVYDDELSHVALGATWLGRWRGDRALWDYYMSCLPFPLTPARARGIGYRPECRRAAQLPEDWIEALTSYVDPFPVTQRRGINATDQG